MLSAYSSFQSMFLFLCTDSYTSIIAQEYSGNGLLLPLPRRAHREHSIAIELTTNRIQERPVPETQRWG